MPDPEQATSPNPLEGWFIEDEPVEIQVAGVRLKAKEIPADRYMRLVSQANRGGTFDTNTYMDLIIREMVVEPALTEEDLGRLKPGIKAALIKQLEGLLGVTPEALKNEFSG
jgi:hypothetical protein